MQKMMHYDTSSLTTGLYEHFDAYAYDDVTTFTRIERYIQKAMRRWHQDQAIRRTIACLSRLDSRQLADIGITADEIPEAARQAVEAPSARDPRTMKAV